MPNTDLRVCVIIVNWNGRDLLSGCLKSVFAQSLEPNEVIVIDNGSQDGSVEYLNQFWGFKIHLIRFSVNQGFTAGVNAGIRQSISPWVALLNTDAKAHPNWLQAMMNVVTQASHVGMCASKILLEEPEERIDKVGHLIYSDGLNGGRGFGEADEGQFDHVEEILLPDGCAALYRRAMFDDVGLFDEQFFAYGDDAELGLRARWYGWTCLYAPTAVVCHRHSTSLGVESARKAFLVERNRIWLAAKLFPKRLLILNPIFSLWRYFWHAYAAVTGKGSAGVFVHHHSFLGLLSVLLRAHISAFLGITEILRKRGQIALNKRLSSVEFLNLMKKYSITAKELALRNR